MRYIFGTDKLRPNAFEVRGMDGSSTGEEDTAMKDMFDIVAGVVHHEDLSLLSEMIKLIGDYIGLLNAHQVLNLNTVGS